MWMDIAVGIMAVIAFGVSAMCFFEGLKDRDEEQKNINRIIKEPSEFFRLVLFVSMYTKNTSTYVQLIITLIWNIICTRFSVVGLCLHILFRYGRSFDLEGNYVQNINS